MKQTVNNLLGFIAQNCSVRVIWSDKNVRITNTMHNNNKLISSNFV